MARGGIQFSDSALKKQEVMPFCAGWVAPRVAPRCATLDSAIAPPTTSLPEPVRLSVESGAENARVRGALDFGPDRSHEATHARGNALY